jgi:hypothetical protein
VHEAAHRADQDRDWVDVDHGLEPARRRLDQDEYVAHEREREQDIIETPISAFSDRIRSPSRVRSN